jgi:hypothetical protein
MNRLQTTIREHLGAATLVELACGAVFVVLLMRWLAS